MSDSVGAIEALGPLDDLGPDEQRVFTDLVGFDALPVPQRGDWRTILAEPPQDVLAYLASYPNVPAPPRDRIALLPLGYFPFDVIEGPELVGLVRTPQLEDMASFVSAFFGLPVDLLARDDLDPQRVPGRDYRGMRQIHAPALIDWLANRLPSDAYGMLALVNVDLYVWPEQEFGFGYSTYRDRLGVVGFSRYDPSFFGEARPYDPLRTIVSRGLRVVVHETAHLFGMAHCQHFRCVLNGVADLRELDALPLHLCPVCLRKLHRVAGVDPLARYAELVPMLERLGLIDEAAWTRARLARVG